MKSGKNGEPGDETVAGRRERRKGEYKVSRKSGEIEVGTVAEWRERREKRD